MLRDLDKYRQQFFLGYLIGVAFRSAFRLSRTPDLTTTHFLRSGFLYDPEPANITKRFRLMDAGMVSFEEAIEKSNDPRARAELQQAAEMAKNRDLKGLPEERKGYTFGALQFTARHARTGKLCYIRESSRSIRLGEREADLLSALPVTSNFAMDTSEEPVPFVDVPTNENWLATLKQALSDPPRSAQQLTILDWTASMGEKKAHEIVQGLAINQRQEWAANPSKVSCRRGDQAHRSAPRRSLSHPSSTGSSSSHTKSPLQRSAFVLR